jgi:hypothetical protein
MFTGVGQRRARQGWMSRRDVLQAGALALGGLTLPLLLERQAQAGTESSARPKSVIMVWLRGGASHIDSYDMKPDAPPEIRGEFAPIATNVPGIHLCEYMPLQARIMDKLAIVRGIKSNDLGDHTPHYIMTGFPDRGVRPSLGAIYSYLRGQRDGVPPYVSMMYRPDHENATYTGPAHQPFVPEGAGLQNLSLARELTPARLDDRRQLLAQLDTLRRDVDRHRTFEAMDQFTLRALDIITSPAARAAFDLDLEPRETHERYGEYSRHLLLARRLVEAGVSVVSLKIGDWDTHEKNFIDMRAQLPQLDQGIHALMTDLYDRGLEKDVAVVVWGEFGRDPRISRGDGRDHWPEAGAALLFGGGFKTGQAIGETDATAARSKGKPYTPANILGNLYRHLGIDTATTIPDYNNRPMHVLDDREVVQEL